MEDAAALLEDLHLKTRKKRTARRDRAPRVSAPITPELREKVLHLASTTKLAQHQIAARVNINPGRVNEILNAARKR